MAAPSPQGELLAADLIPARAGIGLRHRHHDDVLADAPDAAWFEVHAENYMGQGVVADLLVDIRQRYPVSLHAVGLSLGSAEGVDKTHLARLSHLCSRIQPGLVSDHLSWSTSDGVYLPDLLPLPYTRDVLAVVRRNVDQVQAALGRAILVENPSTYYSFAKGDLTEGAFLGELIGHTGCGVLLDINNVAVSAGNLGLSPEAWLQDLLAHAPPAAIGEIHLAGHTRQIGEEGLIVRIDDHGSPVSEPVWRLYAATLARLGPRPTLIEWDTAIPAFSTLQAQAARAQAALDLVVRRQAGRRSPLAVPR